MLYLVGLGIFDERDLPLKAVDILADCSSIYCEMFTSIWHGNLKNLEKFLQKKITIISREVAESDFLIKQAQQNTIALLVPGDPLTATTHIELMLGAKKNNIDFEVIHASSIYTAVAETGLQIYKFGRTTTLPKAQDNFKPASPIDVIKDNDKAGLHTLILLDIGMTGREGLSMLSDAGYGKRRVVVCCKLGSPDKMIRYGNIDEMIENKLVNVSPSVIILTGKIHFKEEEALQLWM